MPVNIWEFSVTGLQQNMVLIIVCSVLLQGCLLIFTVGLNHNSFGSAILLRGIYSMVMFIKYVGIFYKDVHRSIVYYNRMT